MSILLCMCKVEVLSLSLMLLVVVLDALFVLVCMYIIMCMRLLCLCFSLLSWFSWNIHTYFESAVHRPKTSAHMHVRFTKRRNESIILREFKQDTVISDCYQEGD